jgi:hypothetical protein
MAPAIMFLYMLGVGCRTERRMLSVIIVRSLIFNQSTQKMEGTQE